MNESEFNKLLSSVKTNPHALEKLHGYYFGRIVYHLAKTYGKTFAEDVAQDFFLWLLRSESLPRVHFPTTWVYLQCDSIAKRKVQKESRCVSGEPEIPYDPPHKEEVYGDLYDAVKQLDETEQTIIDLHYWEGYSLQEIAPMVGLNYAAVRQRHKRLLAKMRGSLKQLAK